MARTPGGRTRISIGLLVSLAIHVAVLAMVSVDVPEVPATAATLTVIAAIPVPAEPPEPPVTVIEIRPPGISLPMGSAAGSAADASASLAGGVRVASSGSTGQRRLEAPGASTVELAPRAPEVEFTEIVLASAPAGSELDEDSEAAVRRPGRGVVLRAEGASGSSGRGVVGTLGRGLGGGTGGLTIIGPGGDCITPGLPQGGRATNEAVPFGGRSGRVTSARTGGISIGRSR